jgi:hypothetical protein
MPSRPEVRGQPSGKKQVRNPKPPVSAPKNPKTSISPIPAPVLVARTTMGTRASGWPSPSTTCPTTRASTAGGRVSLGSWSGRAAVAVAGGATTAARTATRSPRISARERRTSPSCAMDGSGTWVVRPDLPVRG